MGNYMITDMDLTKLQNIICDAKAMLDIEQHGGAKGALDVDECREILWRLTDIDSFPDEGKQ